MKKSILHFVITFLTFHFLLCISAFSQSGSWTLKANFGGSGRSEAVGFSIGSYGYIGTGTAGSTTKDFWRYDPSGNTWSQMANFAGAARYAATGFAIGNYGYLGTGTDGAGTYFKDFYKYDPTGNSWTAIANFGGNGRYFAAAFSIGNNGYVGTGMDGSVAYNDFWKYNSVTNTWTAKANFGGTVRSDCFGFAVNGKGYIGCGRNFSGSTFYNAVYQYDTTANTWTAKANFGGTVREGVGTFVIGNFAYAGTGSISNFNTRYTDFYRYDPVGNTWSAIANYSGIASTNTSGFSIGGYGYLGTGYNSAFTISFYQYNPCGVTLTVTPTAPACNGGSNGSVNLTVSGATNPLTYLWSNASTVQDPTGLTAGSYSVTVTDAMGCTKTGTVTVTQPTALAGNFTTVTNASCNSLCNGKITVTTSGATPPYTYSWSPSAGTTSAVSNLCAGNYSVTITDSKGCTLMKDTAITQPTALTTSISTTNATSACTCDGQSSAIGIGGTSPYTYAWSPGGQSTSSVTGLCGGTTYTATITDSKGCTTNDTTIIFPLSLTVSLTVTPATCSSCPDGDATANTSGGAGAYTYAWSTSPAQTTQTATGLQPGTYSVCVTDSNGCSICSSTYVGFNVGINEINSENIFVSPNPSNGELTIFNLQNKSYDLSIFNLVGEKMFSDKIVNHPSYAVHLKLPDGIYFISIKSNEEILTKKIIVCK